MPPTDKAVQGLAGTSEVYTYFAYGSNMSLARLRARTPSARPLGCHQLPQHLLRFHKAGRDGSGKCDAWYTGNAQHSIFGALFEIHRDDRHLLDMAEGLGMGYEQKTVTVYCTAGRPVYAETYFATAITERLKPFDWYLDHVLRGARESGLPADYVQQHILKVEPIRDGNRDRRERERAIHR